MLWALRPFFELVIFTNKSKVESEAIVNEIERGENFFTYVVPVNYCYSFPQERIYVKDINIFLGNRKVNEFVLVSTSPYDAILYPRNVIPVYPFMGDDKDLCLNLLE